jgi:DNA mismatch repair protein MutL
MQNKIKLLPDALANKIAAGEVVQRPASVVKELVENAMDAGATDIHVLVEQAGKTLIQVIDNGSGMTEQDARMAFERHATSKIESISDLEAISTMGFRGEALASIASVAKAELKTRRAEDEVGTRVEIHGSKVIAVEGCGCPVGTSIAVRHLFYNVPARRKFLKKDVTEFKVISNEFIRAALARPDVQFKLTKDGEDIFFLRAGSLRQRLSSIFDKKTNENLIPVEQDMDWVHMSGFVGRPDIFKKTRGDQYLFVNGRYVQSPYLMHGIRSAYTNLIPEGTHPFIVLYLNMDPTKVDVNVHPTKHEVKFDDERILYNMVHVAIKHGLGKYALTPMIDFESPTPAMFERAERPSQASQDAWKQLYSESPSSPEQQPQSSEQAIVLKSDFEKQEGQLFDPSAKKAFQLHKKYIIQQVKSGILVVNQNRAHERVLYERHLALLESGEVYSQKELFPKVVHISAEQMRLFKSFAGEARCLGFEVEEFGEDAVIIHGTPAHLTMVSMEADVMFKDLLDAFTENIELKLSVKENVAQALAAKCAVRTGQVLEDEQMNELIDALFACENPYRNPRGKKCFVILEHQKLDNLFAG